MNRSLLLVLAGVAAIVVLFVVLRSTGDDGSSTATTAPTATTGSSGTTAGSTTVTTTTAAPVRIVIPITVEGAKPVGGIKRAKVTKGQKVALVVTSDTEDEIHLHGYDLHADVENGKARIDFTASIPGRFEAELEQHGVQILDLQVNP